MPLVSTRQLLDEAAKAVTASAHSTSTIWNRFRPSWKRRRETNSPSSFRPAAARAVRPGQLPLSPDLAANELYPEIPIAMHLDHGNSFETCVSAIKLGYSSVMMDARSRKTARPRLPLRRMWQ